MLDPSPADGVPAAREEDHVVGAGLLLLPALCTEELACQKTEEENERTVSVGTVHTAHCTTAITYVQCEMYHLGFLQGLVSID